MLAPLKPVTVEQFEDFIYLPDNRDRRFELIGGGIVEGVSSNRSVYLESLFIR